ncbi:Fibronectin [Nibea albiflora]|uniref:Fibronectin n=1 Tax=Nibea albiflora TaxID=240163 RepID=A0ACB7EV04_NIBAL|nr:Fibronectin [Nibea albiflora]
MQNGTIDSTDEPSVTGTTISDSTDEPSVTGTTISDSTDEPSVTGTTISDSTDVYNVTGNTISDSTDVYNVTGNTISDSTDVYNVTGNTTDEFADVHNLAGNTTNSTSLWESRMHNGTNDTAEAENATTATPYTTVVTPGTPTLPLEAQCARSPMLFPDVPDPDENYIEDSCVAMLSFGPWVEKNCFELLPYICYDDDLTFETNATSVTNLTSVSATLTWRPVLDVTDYKLEVKGHPEQGRNLTNVTHGLDDLTPGTRYSVHVFPIKCGRDLKAQEFSFTTIPNKVENLTVLSQNETSTLYLRWDKPVGNVDVYRILYSGKKFETNNTHAKVGDLTPGGLYTFTAISVATGPNSTESKESTITVYTKPGQASNLTVSNNTQESLQLSWLRPSGNTTGYRVKALDENNTVRYDQKVKGTKANVTGLPRSQKITLSVVALANDTLEGDNKTTFSYTDRAQMDGSTEESYNTSVRMKKFHGLKTAAKYTVIVYIINGDISGSAVQCSIFTLPLQPTDPRISSHGKDYITFSWTAPANSSTVSYVAEIKSQFYGYHALKVVKQHSVHLHWLELGDQLQSRSENKGG